MNILYQVIESQTHVGMPRGAKLSCAHNEPKYFVIQIPTLPPPSTDHK